MFRTPAEKASCDFEGNIWIANLNASNPRTITELVGGNPNQVKKCLTRPEAEMTPEYIPACGNGLT